METGSFSSRTGIGNQGVRLVSPELLRRGYELTVMPNQNPGFDGITTSPRGISAEIEVKCSTSKGTQVPMQIKTHLECRIQQRFYVIVKNHETDKAEFFIMTHEEIQLAWERMPKVKPNGEPYVIRGTGYIDWKFIQPHRDRWDKLPS